jgi:hypothetical protein
MRIFKWLVLTSLATTILPMLQAEPRCPGNVVSLPLQMVQRSLRSTTPVHTAWHARPLSQTLINPDADEIDSERYQSMKSGIAKS